MWERCQKKATLRLRIRGATYFLKICFGVFESGAIWWRFLMNVENVGRN